MNGLAARAFGPWILRVDGRTLRADLVAGVLGALLNTVSARELAPLKARGIQPDAALNPHLAASLPAETLDQIRHAIAGGLKWVFVAMLAAAIVQLALTLRMPKKKPDHVPTAGESLQGAAA